MTSHKNIKIKIQKKILKKKIIRKIMKSHILNNKELL